MSVQTKITCDECGEECKDVSKAFVAIPTLVHPNRELLAWAIVRMEYIRNRDVGTYDLCSHACALQATTRLLIHGTVHKLSSSRM